MGKEKMPCSLTLAFEQVLQMPSMVQLSLAVCDASSSPLGWNSLGSPVTVFAHTSILQCVKNTRNAQNLRNAIFQTKGKQIPVSCSTTCDLIIHFTSWQFVIHMSLHSEQNNNVEMHM